MFDGTGVIGSKAPEDLAAAYQMLFQCAKLRPGQTVLVHGAAGNVGCYAVQLAKSHGANVIATTSESDFEFVRSLGADTVLDDQKDRFENELFDLDIVVDTVGGETQERSFRVLKRGGILVSTVSPPSEDMARANGVRTEFVIPATNCGFTPLRDQCGET